MQKLVKHTVFFCLLMEATALSSQSVPQGRVIEGKSIKSRILGRELHYAVYLPPD